MLCTFMGIVRELAVGSKYYNEILEIAESLDMYLCAGDNPNGTLNVLLSLRALPQRAKKEIRKVIRKALVIYINEVY